jgi:hypothetical protein
MLVKLVEDGDRLKKDVVGNIHAHDPKMFRDYSMHLIDSDSFSNKSINKADQCFMDWLNE